MNRGPSRNNKYKYGAEVLASGEDLATSVPRQRVRKGTDDGEVCARVFGAVTISSRLTNHVSVSVLVTPSDTETGRPNPKAISPAAQDHIRRAKDAQCSGGNQGPNAPRFLFPFFPWHEAAFRSKLTQ